jgi:hypothetical protein
VTTPAESTKAAAEEAGCEGNVGVVGEGDSEGALFVWPVRVEQPAKSAAVTNEARSRKVRQQAVMWLTFKVDIRE